MHSWIGRRWYDFAYWTCFFGFTFGYSLRVQGRRHIPKRGPVLLVSNHQSFLDPFLVDLASPRYVTSLARDSLFRNPILGGLISSLGAIPIHREVGKEGLQTTLDALGRQETVVVFAEGERTHDGSVSPLKAGIALLIKRVQAPIVPLGIAGSYEAWSRHDKVPKLAPLFLAPSKGSLAVSIGKSINSSTLAAMPRTEMLAYLRDKVAAEVQHAEGLRRKRRGVR